MRTREMIGAVLLSIAVGGCGGGGGGSVGAGGPVTAADATVVITQNNANDIVRVVNDSSSFADSIVLSLITGIASPVSVSAAATQQGIATVSPAAVQTVACQISGTADVDSGDDFVDVEFNNCEDFSFDGILLPGLSNGGLNVELPPSDFVSETDFVANIEFRQFSNDDGSLQTTADGDVSLDYFETMTQIDVDVTTEMLDYDFAGVSYTVMDYSYDTLTTPDTLASGGSGGVMASTVNGLIYFEITTNFVTEFGDTWPRTGVLIIYGDEGRRIRLSALNDAVNARVDLDLDGTGGFEIIGAPVTWETLFELQ